MKHPSFLEQYSRLAQIFQKKDLDSRVVNFLDTHAGETLFVACSGGSDSLCLLYLIRLHWPQNTCVLLHYNHKVRQASDREANHMRSLAQQLDVPIEIGERDLSQSAKDEQQLRNLRYNYFTHVLNRHRGRCLILGQHQDDLFETFLMRFVRGSSLEGLVAPKPVQYFPNHQVRLRPLLTLSKTQITEACNALNIPYVTDETNANTIYLRNRVRHHLLPCMDRIFGKNQWRSGFQKTCELVLEQQQGVDTICDLYRFKEKLTQTSIANKWITSMPLYLQRKFITEWFMSFGIKTITFSMVEKTLRALKHGIEYYYLTLNSQYRICIKDGKIQCQSYLSSRGNKLHMYFPIASHIYFPHKACLSGSFKNLSEADKEKIFSGYYADADCTFLDAEKLTQKLHVRSWQPGDRYRPIYFDHEKKIKNLFVERKINHSTRHQVPVICDDNNQIIWIPGLPPAHYFKVEPQTKLSVFLTYKIW
ncbi:MAG: tRNA lysidine(34) synthetase TilS [Puniceicoccales bacterium]|jgi:tRNA(Ile)-lysidine synthase|nr:tRNA lysidine(34) synthetase TilS [Puniceicoccales bacterium]